MIPRVDGQQQRTTLNHSILAAQHRRLNVSVCLTVTRKEVGRKSCSRSVENLVSRWNGYSRARNSSAWHRHLGDNAGQGSAKPRTTVTVVNVVNVAAISRRHSTEDLDGSRERWPKGFARDSPYPDAQCKRLDMIWVSEWARSCSREDAGQDPIINVALAHAFADIAPRHKSKIAKR